MKSIAQISKVAVLASLLLGMSASAFADFADADKHPPRDAFEHSAPPHHEGEFFPLPPHLRGLALTEAQQDKVFEIVYPLLPSMRDNRKQKHELVQALRKLGNSDSLDEAKLKELSEKLATLEKNEAINRTRVESKIYAVLTLEQREKLANQDNFGFEHEHLGPAGFVRPAFAHHPKLQNF
jgi:periplasmic protein CpxP/Spy